MTPVVKLADGNIISQVGLGLWQVKNQAEFNIAFDAAIVAGYRHFDTAQVYGNEAWLGEAIKNCGLKREELYITTKVSASAMMAGHAEELAAESFKKLQTEYIDLFLIHFPVPVARKGGWKMLEKLKAEGGVRSIGVSNYTIHHLKHMKHYAEVMPVVNQIEMHIFLQRPELLQYCRDNDIAVEAYSPLAHASDTSNATIQSIAAKHGKSYAQIMLRWCVQQGVVVLPKSVTPSRIAENIDIFNFELDDKDMQQLQAENRNKYTCRPTAPARFLP